MAKLVLEFVGIDSWDRPVYKCDGHLYVDVDPRADRAPGISAKDDNDFDGEPGWPIAEGTEVEFVPSRCVW